MRQCEGSFHRFLAPVPLPLLSQHHSTALPSPKRYEIRYEVRYLAQRESIYRDITYQEDKRCMLVPTIPGPDFWAGRVGRRIGSLLFATHPHRPAIRELALEI